MATYFESGVGKAILDKTSAKSADLGRLAASEALSQRDFKKRNYFQNQLIYREG